MMTAINKYLIGLLLVAVAVFFFTLSYEVTQVGKHVSNTLMSVSDTSASLNKTVTNINNTILDIDTTVTGLSKPKTGTISVINADLGAIRLAVDNVNQAALSERFFLEKTQPEEVAKLNNVVDTANSTIQHVQPLLTNASDELLALQTATHSFNTLISDPQLSQTVTNINSTSKHLNATSEEIEKTSADVQHEVHEYVYPGPWKRVWGYISGVGMDVGKLFIP